MTKRYFGNIITDTPTEPTANSGSNYGVASGVWSLSEAREYSSVNKWPVPADAPGAPTIGTALPGNASATVAFTPNGDDGGLTPTFTATSSPGSFTGTGSSSPVTVSGLTNGTSYTFTVTATNAAGTSAASSASNSVTPAVPDTAIFPGGATWNGNVAQSTARYIDISTTGDSATWGSLNTGAIYYTAAGASSSTRCVFGGGNQSGTVINNLQYATYSSQSSFSDFGDLLAALYGVSGGSNSTRGIFWGGRNGPASDVIQYITIASTGNSTDFGDTYPYGQDKHATYTDGTYFFSAGGQLAYTGSYTSRRDRVTIASTGNYSYYGALYQSRQNVQGASNSTYGIVGGGTQASSIATIDRHTMSSSGTSSFFGNMSQTRSDYAAVSNSTRCVFYGGNEYTSYINSIQYVNFATTGNTIDFGDINGIGTNSIMRVGGASNSHGGL